MFRSLLCFGFAVAFAAASAPAFAQTGPDFGAPPSGSIPILFNDHHVYAKPSGITGNRAIAALVRGDEVLVPLRSLFEQMGATVSYDGPSRTVTILAPQRNISLTVDQPVVVINGESRPLDVPPVFENGIVLVPIRVIAETLGAYVQWDPAVRVVVVRFVNYSNVPSPSGPLVTPAPAGPAGPAPPISTSVETPIPTPLLQAPPTPSPYEHFIAGDFNLYQKVFNELSPGNRAKSGSFDVRAAAEFPLFKVPAMVGADYEDFSYAHLSGIGLTLEPPGFNPCPHFGGTPPFPAAGNEGCVTQVGGFSQAAVPDFTAHESQFDARLGFKVFNPRVYIAGSYMTVTNDYADLYDFPALNGFGIGLEKLPDLENQFSLYGNIYYYPSVSGDVTFPAFGVPPDLAGTTEKLEQRFLKYQIGADVKVGQSLFLDAGFLGDSIRGGNLSPSNASHASGYAGLGFKF